MSEPDLSYIAEGLRSLAVPIDSVTPDPANPMDHPQDNLDAIALSLEKYGQRKPLVVNKRNGFIEAGNGTWEAAQSLGWEYVAVLYVDDDAAVETGYKIADNRTAQLSRWNAEVLARLFKTVDDPTEIPGVSLQFVENVIGYAAAMRPEWGEDEEAAEGPAGAARYEDANIRQLILHYTVGEYEDVLGMLSAIRAHHGFESNTEAATLAIRRYSERLKGGPS